MIGELGVAQTALAPEGQVLVRGEYWDAIARLRHSSGRPGARTERYLGPQAQGGTGLKHRST